MHLVQFSLHVAFIHSFRCTSSLGGGPRVVVSTAAFHAKVRGSVPGLGGLKETKMFLPHPRVKVSIVESLRDREVACSASDRQGSNFEYCVWRTVSSQSSHHPQEVLLAQFSLYVHKGGLKPDSFHFCTSSPMDFYYSKYTAAHVFNRIGDQNPQKEPESDKMYFSWIRKCYLSHFKSWRIQVNNSMNSLA